MLKDVEGVIAALYGIRLFGIGFVHFLYSRWIWKLSNPLVRATIGRDLWAQRAGWDLQSEPARSDGVVVADLALLLEAQDLARRPSEVGTKARPNGWPPRSWPCRPRPAPWAGGPEGFGRRLGTAAHLERTARDMANTDLGQGAADLGAHTLLETGLPAFGV